MTNTPGPLTHKDQLPRDGKADFEYDGTRFSLTPLGSTRDSWRVLPGRLEVRELAAEHVETGHMLMLGVAVGNEFGEIETFAYGELQDLGRHIAERIND
ncbi:hypothetical protein [Leucobacter sp. BZR 635]